VKWTIPTYSGYFGKASPLWNNGLSGLLTWLHAILRVSAFPNTTSASLSHLFTSATEACLGLALLPKTKTRWTLHGGATWEFALDADGWSAARDN